MQKTKTKRKHYKNWKTDTQIRTGKQLQEQKPKKNIENQFWKNKEMTEEKKIKMNKRCFFGWDRGMRLQKALEIHNQVYIRGNLIFLKSQNAD